jgi:hypothetical protein
VVSGQAGIVTCAKTADGHTGSWTLLAYSYCHYMNAFMVLNEIDSAVNKCAKCWPTYIKAWDGGQLFDAKRKAVCGSASRG